LVVGSKEEEEEENESTIYKLKTGTII